MKTRRTDDCGDTNCVLRDRSKPGGMRTNGGCQHLKEGPHETRALVRELAAELVAQRARAEAAELGCEVLSVGDPYERLRDTIAAANITAKERDLARSEVVRLRALVLAKGAP